MPARPGTSSILYPKASCSHLASFSVFLSDSSPLDQPSYLSVPDTPPYLLDSFAHSTAPNVLCASIVCPAAFPFIPSLLGYQLSPTERAIVPVTRCYSSVRGEKGVKVAQLRGTRRVWYRLLLLLAGREGQWPTSAPLTRPAWRCAAAAQPAGRQKRGKRLGCASRRRRDGLARGALTCEPAQAGWSTVHSSLSAGTKQEPLSSS